MTAPETREIEISDAVAVAQLNGELGYPATVATTEERIGSFRALRDRIAYVACLDGAVVGWIDVGVVCRLQTDAYAEIGGLVVSSACRSGGIGAELMRRAEQWARERGLKKMVVRSQVAREAAHRFYLRRGYERTKTSAVFTKPFE